MTEKTITLLDPEIKAIIGLLAQCPYSQVHQLIAKIQDQARAQDEQPPT